MHNTYNNGHTHAAYIDHDATYTATTATSTAGISNDYLQFTEPNYLYGISNMATDAAYRSIVYRDLAGNAYDVDEMISLLYNINDRLKRLENYYIGKKLEELLTGNDEVNECQ